MKRNALKIIAVIFILLATLWTGIRLYTGTEEFSADTAKIVSKEASEMLGVRVDVGGIRVNSPFAVAADKLALYDKEGKIVAEAESAEVRFSLFSVLFGKTAAAIEEVAIERPKVSLTKRTNGIWNYEDLLSESKEDSGFRAKVIIKSGVLSLSFDEFAETLTDIDGSIRFMADSEYDLDIAGKLKEGALKLDGVYGEKAMNLTVSGENVELAERLKLLPKDLLAPEIKPTAGRIDKFSVRFTKDGEEMKYNGKLSLTDGAVTLYDAAVRNLSCGVSFNDTTVHISLNADSDGGHASAEGRIFLEKEPRFDLKVTSDAFSPEKVFKDSEFKGEVKCRFHITGPMKNPLITAELKSRDGEALGVPVKNVTARAAYAENILSVESLEGEACSGTFKTVLRVEVDTLKFDGTVDLYETDISEAKELVPDVSGKITAQLAFSGEGADKSKLSVYGSAEGVGVGVKGLLTEELYTSFFAKGGNIEIDYLSLRLPDEGRLGIEGKISADNVLDLEFYGSKVNLKGFNALHPMLDISGLSDFRGAVRGPADNPRVWAKFAAIKGALFKQPYRSLHGEVLGSLDGVMIKDFAMENGAQDVWLVKGTAGFVGEKRLNLQIDTVGARMEDIAALVAPTQPITGNVDNILTITGTLDNPDIVGYIHFYRGSYAGMLLQGMDGDYTLKNGVTTLQDFRIFSPFVDMVLNGTIDKALNLNLHVAAKELSLDRFGNRLPYPMSGSGTFDGAITGSVDAPVFNGRLEAKELDLNGAKVLGAHGNVAYKANTVSFDDFGFDLNGGRVSINAKTRIDSGALYGRLTVSNTDVNDLMRTFNFGNDYFYGRLNGEIDVGGKVSSLQANVRGDIKEGVLGGSPIHDVTLDAELNGKLLTLKNFSGKQGTMGSFASLGKVDFGGSAVEFIFTADDIEANVLPRAAGLKTDINGKMDIDVTVHGSLDNPSADVSLLIENTALKGGAFDNIVGLISLRDRVVNVDKFIVEKTDKDAAYRLKSHGSLPLAALMADKGYEGEERFNLRIELEDTDLDLLSIFEPSFDWGIGKVNGNLLLTGTMANPLINGEISLKDGALKYKPLKLPITEMNTKIIFTGDTMTVEEFTGRMGKGTYKLAGSCSIDGFELTSYDFSFNADKLEVISDVYTGPLTMNFTLSEGEFYRLRLPKLSGKIFLEDTTLSLPQIPETDGELPRFIVDVDLELGKKVRFYSPYLADLKLEGSAHFGGTTRYPRSSGSIRVLRGKVNYLKTPFTVREGTLAFSNVGSFLPMVKFEADTRLSKTRVYLSVSGPIDEMKLGLRSSPDMRREDILKLLTFRVNPSEAGKDNDYSSFAELGLQMAVLSALEAQMRDFLQLDEFSINRDLDRTTGDRSNKEQYNVEIGKYISDKVMLTLLKGIGSRKVRYGVQYDFNDRFNVSVKRDEDKAFLFGVEARFSF